MVLKDEGWGWQEVVVKRRLDNIIRLAQNIQNIQVPFHRNFLGFSLKLGAYMYICIFVCFLNAVHACATPSIPNEFLAICRFDETTVREGRSESRYTCTQALPTLQPTFSATNSY